MTLRTSRPLGALIPRGTSKSDLGCVRSRRGRRSAIVLCSTFLSTSMIGVGSLPAEAHLSLSSVPACKASAAIDKRVVGFGISETVQHKKVQSWAWRTMCLDLGSARADRSVKGPYNNKKIIVETLVSFSSISDGSPVSFGGTVKLEIIGVKQKGKDVSLGTITLFVNRTLGFGFETLSVPPSKLKGMTKIKVKQKSQTGDRKVKATINQNVRLYRNTTRFDRAPKALPLQGVFKTEHAQYPKNKPWNWEAIRISAPGDWSAKIKGGFQNKTIVAAVDLDFTSVNDPYPFGDPTDFDGRLSIDVIGVKKGKRAGESTDVRFGSMDIRITNCEGSGTVNIKRKKLRGVTAVRFEQVSNDAKRFKGNVNSLIRVFHASK